MIISDPGVFAIAKRILPQYEIPYFIDMTMPVKNHPCVDALTHVLRIVDENFSYDSVFAFLKSGVVKSLEQSEIEMLENYVLARGRKGIRSWSQPFLNGEDDTVDEPTRQKDTQQFRYFGSLLLRQGGEIGFHGYNHQPLVLPNTDYKGLYAYRQWPSEEAITAAMEELIEFQQTVLPYTNGTVYVPPSNILSAEGRRVLGTKVPQIRTIASTYFKDGTDLPYVQEFGVATDGIVEQPRIVSGGMVGDTYMRLAAMSELNMHYVSTHFMHPDDLLDEDRGAAEGWEVYKGGLEDYLKWLSTSAPDLRRQTGTECSGAIQRYAQLTVALDSTDTAWTLHLGNFVDEAWLFFRANEGTPGRVTNGELTHLTGDLYLLKATAETVRIERKGA